MRLSEIADIELPWQLTARTYQHRLRNMPAYCSVITVSVQRLFHVVHRVRLACYTDLRIFSRFMCLVKYHSQG